jgi:ATP-dependent helicase/nuclease subunit A
MNKPTLTDAASRHRIVTDLTSSLIVEAGAGSGKTHMMAARMAAGISAGVYQVEHMAAVTFTRKAAAELRGRFQSALEGELIGLSEVEGQAVGRADAPNVGRGFSRAEQAVRLTSALSNLERLFSGTIHAFCARLLRERPIEAGVAPGFTELDDVEERLMRESSWHEFRAQARAAGNPDLALLNDAGIKAKDLDGAFAAVCNYEDVDFPAEDVPAPDVDAAWVALDAFWTELTRHLPTPIDPETSCKTQKKVLQFQRAWPFALRGRRTGARLADLLRMWDFDPGITQNRWADDSASKKRINGIVPPLHEQFRTDVVSPWLEAWKRHLYAPCIRLLLGARTFAQHERRQRNTLSFNDLLIRTAKVLRENESVRRALQDKYRWIFVDEFQDTDPLQAEIMFALQRPASSLRSPGSSDPGNGALYVVGDPKQSIYRFRRADIDIYNHVRRVIGGDDDANVVPLTTNFRSVPVLCEWANTVFAATFPAQGGAYSPAFAPLEPALSEVPSKAEGGVEGRVEGLFTLRSSDQSEEATTIAKYIHTEVASGRRGYGDFLILTRKRKPLKVYVEALEQLQIPIEVAGAGAFGESAQVRELSQLLHALADPQDAVALVGVLRGPFFGLSDRALYAWKQSGGYLGLWSELDESVRRARALAPPIDNVANALETLRTWHRWTRALPVAAALDRILEDSGYFALAATTTGGVEAGDVLHAVDRVRAAVESGFTLAEAAEALQDAARESSEVESWPLEPGRPDVVRVMNLHKAKGLEAEVVFLVDPKGGYAPDPEIRILRRARALAPPEGFLPIVRKSDTSWASTTLALPPDWDTHAAEEQKYLDAEEDRLLYVAATRAKDVLVVGRATRPAKNGAWSGLDDFLTDAPELSVPDQVSVPASATVDFAAGTSAIAHAETAHTFANHATWSSTSVTEGLSRAWALAPPSGAPPVPPNPSPNTDPTATLTNSTPARRADAGVAWGTLVHGLLEHAMRFPQATPADLRRLALWLTVDEPDLRPLIDEAVATVEGVAQADFWATAKMAPEAHEEAPFAVRETVDGLPQVLTGVIDLVYRSGAEWQIVDYKTDVGAKSEDLAAKYAGQMRSYESAWRSVTVSKAAATLVATRRRSPDGA